ncbi:MAG TPA: WYL domain-containing protein [Flavobacteriaceae bacterium]|nr:WYL domain-containing protein [Flavobacteriaceae bacterium]HIP48466.1 WYL domain-containing protein [Lutibacter sp.]
MKKHDTLATRLSLILIKLNNAERFTVDELAKEFNVTKRTIQRDLNERFTDIPLKKEDGVYFLEAQYLGKITFDDINNLATLSGLDKMFPSFSKEFVQHLLVKNVSKAYLIKTHNFEDIGHKLDDFKAIERAILNLKVITLHYRNQERRVHPYKFANVKGIWYLVALQDEVIKTFTFSKIRELHITDSNFTIDSTILKCIEDEETIWFSNSKTEVILKIDSSIAQFFKRRKVLVSQKIVEEYEDGSLLISTQMTFEDEVLQLVRSMIPYIWIVSPSTLQDKLENSLEVYLSKK